MQCEHWKGHWKIKNAAFNVLIGEKSELIKFPDRGRYVLSS